MSGNNGNSFTIQNENMGEIQIADDAIGLIAALSIQDIEGVCGTQASMPAELAKKIGFKMTGGGIKTTFVDEEIEVEIPLVLKYGYNIMDVSAKVQEKVKSAIQNMTGFNVLAVNVKVSGINVEQ